MNSRSQQLAARRLQLQQRCEVQRTTTATLIQQALTPLQSIDAGWASARQFLIHPLTLAGGGVLALFIGPRRILRFASRAWLLTAAVRRLIGLIK
jgi:hypothetical protein